MLHAMKFFRNFVLITMLVNGSFVLASGLFPFKLDSNKSSELVNRTPALLQHSKFDWFKNINIEPCTTFVIDNTTFVINKAMNNPKMSGVVATVILSGIILCILKKAMSENQWQKFWTELKNFVVSKMESVGSAFFNILPSGLQTVVLVSKNPLISLGNNIIFRQSCSGLLAMTAGGSYYLGWYRESLWAMIGCLASTYWALRAKMDENQAETNQNFKKAEKQLNEVRDDLTEKIKAVGDKADKISGQITNLEKELLHEINDAKSDVKQTVSLEVGKVNDKAEKIFSEIVSLKKTFEEEGRLASEVNQQALLEVNVRIIKLEESLKKIIKDVIANETLKLSADIGQLQKEQYETAERLQQSIDSCTTLINTYRIEDKKEFVVMRDSFIDKVSDLSLTLKEAMIALNNEVTEKQDKMLGEIKGLSSQFVTLEEELAKKDNITSKKIEDMINSTATFSNRLKSLENQAKKIEMVGGQLGKKLTNEMVDLSQGVVGAVLEIRKMMQTLKKVKLEQKDQKSAIENVSTQQAIISERQISQGVDLKNIVTKQNETDTKRDEEFQQLKAENETLKSKFSELEKLIKENNAEIRSDFKKNNEDLKEDLKKDLKGYMERGDQRFDQLLNGQQQMSNDQKKMFSETRRYLQKNRLKQSRETKDRSQSPKLSKKNQKKEIQEFVRQRIGYENLNQKPDESSF